MSKAIPFSDEPTLVFAAADDQRTVHLRREIIDHAVRCAARGRRATAERLARLSGDLARKPLPRPPIAATAAVDVAGGWPVFPLAAALLVLLVTVSMLGLLGGQAAERREAAGHRAVAAPLDLGASATATSARAWTDE